MQVVASLRLSVAAALAAALACASATAAGWQPPPPPRPPPVPLRLDESPALPLLAPFRNARGVSGSSLRSYLDGPYGGWRNRPWHTVCWRPDSGPRSPGAEGESWSVGLDPAVSCAPSVTYGPDLLDAGAELLGLRTSPEGAGRWPLVVTDGHWFQPERVDLVRTGPGAAPPPLSVSPSIMPPWLQRLDDGWAGVLLSSSGCGRGGDCSTDVSFPGQAFEPLWTALAPKAWPVPAWKCKPRKVTIGRFGRETDSFELVRCDGSVAPDAIDRLSIIARPAGVERPGDLFPDEPDPRAKPGEWLPDIRIMDPRLLWVLQAVANAHPHRPIYIYSGYRPAPAPPITGSRNSYHWLGRALDIHVHGVPNEELFAICHGLDDVGCGFYPNKPFVHVDVRPYGHGRVFWIDVSRTGERARYVDSWPGVVDNGAMAWAPPSG